MWAADWLMTGAETIETSGGFVEGRREVQVLFAGRGLGGPGNFAWREIKCGQTKRKGKIVKAALPTSLT